MKGEILPHLIIEYPQDVVPAPQLEVLLDALHGAAVATDLFEPTHIRVRAVPLVHYRVAGLREPYIHVQCRIHAGRSAVEKRELSEAVLGAVSARVAGMRSITVEVVEMERGSYAKLSDV